MESEVNKYIIGFDKLPCCIYRENDEVITQFTFPNSLIPASILIKKGEPLEINGKSYIVKDRIDIICYPVVKCLEDR